MTQSAGMSDLRFAIVGQADRNQLAELRKLAYMRESSDTQIFREDRQVDEGLRDAAGVVYGLWQGDKLVASTRVLPADSELTELAKINRVPHAAIVGSR